MSSFISARLFSARGAACLKAFSAFFVRVIGTIKLRSEFDLRFRTDSRKLINEAKLLGTDFVRAVWAIIDIRSVILSAIESHL